MYKQSNSRYCYPNSNVLINIPGFKDQQQLNAFERIVTLDRLRLLSLKPIMGSYDLSHLCTIHSFIFNDIYPFAGELREEDIAKDHFRFAPVQFLANQAIILLDELKSENWLKGLEFEKTVDRLAHYLTELNVLHPFREGNGRTQREFIRSLALEVGLYIDFTQVDPAIMLKAMIESPYDNQRLKYILYTITSKKRC